MLEADGSHLIMSTSDLCLFFDRERETMFENHIAGRRYTAACSQLDCATDRQNYGFHNGAVQTELPLLVMQLVNAKLRRIAANFLHSLRMRRYVVYVDEVSEHIRVPVLALQISCNLWKQS